MLLLSVLNGLGVPGYQSIHTAAREGNLEEVNRQLAWGVNPNSHHLITRDTSLIGAAVNGHADVVKLLIEKGADVNVRAIYGRTPLYTAFDKGDVEMGRILLEHGAEPTLECNGHRVSEEFLKSLQQDDSSQRP